MNSLDQLISQYCPAGVPMMRLGEVGTIIRGNGLQKSDFREYGVGCIHYGQIYTYFGIFAGKTISFVDPELAEKLTQVNTGDIIIATTSENIEDVCKSVCWLGQETIVSGAHAVVYKHSQNPKYIAYCLRTWDFFAQKKKYAYGAKVIDIKTSDLANISIPLPPLPVQEEIVRILDAMSDLVTNLDAEISTRQKQYEHAREKLICQQNYEQVTFESLGEIVRGKRFVRNDITESGTPCIHYGDMYTYYGVSASEARTHLQGEIVSKMRYAKKNDVIIVGAGENNEDIGVALAWLGDQPAAVHDACYIISHEQNPVYISQYTRTGIYHEQLKKIVVDGKICSFPLKGLAQLSIPLPPLSVQQSIVERLDKMESLIQNLQAERALRQKQYEYYREKLLTFERT